MQYVVDTLLLVKEKEIKLIHKCLDSFDKNIKFTTEMSIFLTSTLTKTIQASITN